MHDNIRQETFRDLVYNPAIFAVARKIITENYIECSEEYEDEMRLLLDQAFDRLSACRQDEQAFQSAITYLNTQLFKKQDPDFWFNQVYLRYKRTIKPGLRYTKMQEWILGQRVLDLGCGDGLTGLEIARHGYRVYMADVLDYRDAAARDLPFRSMPDPGSIPYPEQSFDTAILMAVLHHVERKDLYPLLAGLRRTCRRVIIEEDSYGLPARLDGLTARLQQDPQLQSFHKLPVEDQLRLLMFIDYFANAITQGLTQMDMPYNFQSVEEWQDLFLAQGFALTRTLVMGFQKQQFNRSCHIWFVLDVL